MVFYTLQHPFITDMSWMMSDLRNESNGIVKPAAEAWRLPDARVQESRRYRHHHHDEYDILHRETLHFVYHFGQIETIAYCILKLLGKVLSTTPEENLPVCTREGESGRPSVSSPLILESLRARLWKCRHP